jgi:outer membrane immunogenic protein
MICIACDNAQAPAVRRLRKLTRRFALCALLAALAGGQASAADLLDDSWLRGSLGSGPVRWDGVVMGGQIGYAAMNSDFGSSTSSQIAFLLRNTTLENEAQPSSWTTLPHDTTNAKSFGAFIGYNIQWDDIVLGADLGYSKMMNAQTSASDSMSRIVTTSDSVQHNVTIAAASSTKIIDYGTARLRAGYPIGQFLPYAMLGVAVGRFDYSNTSTVFDHQVPPAPAAPIDFGPVTQSENVSHKFGYGYVYGLGADVAIMPNMFLRGEWESVAFNKVGGIRTTLNTARVGIGLRF